MNGLGLLPTPKLSMRRSLLWSAGLMTLSIIGLRQATFDDDPKALIPLDSAASAADKAESPWTEDGR